MEIRDVDNFSTNYTPGPGEYEYSEKSYKIPNRIGII